MARSFQAVRVPKAGELVASALRTRIVTGALEDGATLPAEAVLMEQFGVSRPTLREAFRILESECLVDVRRGSRGGARVRVPDGLVAARQLSYTLQFRNTPMDDIYRARTMLESSLMTLLVEDLTDDTVSTLAEAIKAGAERLNRIDEWVKADIDFHLLVAKLTNNTTLSVMLEMLFDIIVQARLRYDEVVPSEELAMQHAEVHKTHEYFLKLLQRGDIAEAEDLWRRHLQAIEQHYRAQPIADTAVEMMG